jgi:hypothetical protein
MKQLIAAAALFAATSAHAYVQVGDKIDITNHVVCQYAETFNEALEAYKAEGRDGAVAVWRGAIAMGTCSKAVGSVTIVRIERRTNRGIAVVKTDHVSGGLAGHSYTIVLDMP